MNKKIFNVILFLLLGTHLFSVAGMKGIGVRIVDWLEDVIAGPPPINPNALHYASEADTVRMIHSLVNDHGAKVDDTNVLGQTPLMIACQASRLDIVNALLLHSANVSNPDSAGKPVIFYAAAGSNVAIIERLLNAGASARIKFEEQQPWQCARNRLVKQRLQQAAGIRIAANNQHNPPGAARRFAQARARRQFSPSSRASSPIIDLTLSDDESSENEEPLHRQVRNRPRVAQPY